MLGIALLVFREVLEAALIVTIVAVLGVGLGQYRTTAAAPEPAKPQAAATKPVLKVIPGKVIIPTDAMRRIWGELVSIDFATRTGTFRKEGTDEIMKEILGKQLGL